MKKIFSFAFLLIVVSAGASAQIRRNTDSTQNRVTTADKKGQRLNMMQSLNLSKEQMGQLKELRKAQKQQRESIMDDQSLSDMQRQEKLKEMHRQQNDKMKTILTPEQMDQFKEQRRNNMQQSRHDKKMRPGLQENKSDIDNNK